MSRPYVIYVAAALLSLLGAHRVAARPTVGAIGDICARTVGVEPGERHFDACVGSLTQSALVQGRSAELAAGRRDCLAQGLAPHSPALAECELAINQAPVVPAAHSSSPPPPGGRRSYFAVSREIGFERDRLACAELGIEPAEPAFDQCAVDLRAALAQASMPMN